MEVKFGNVPVSLVGFITTNTAQEHLTMEWIANPNSLYTAILYDIDSPYPAPNNIDAPYLNMLVTNIKGMDMGSGSPIISYNAPSPPPNSLPHTYNADIYLQIGPIQPVQHSVRKNFDLVSFVNRHNLDLVNRSSFKVGQLVSTGGNSSSSNNIPTQDSSQSQTQYQPQSIPTSVRVTETTNFFKAGSDLPEKKKKWCRCILKVADKQRGTCNIDRAWFESRNGQTCYSPYRICSKSVGTSSRECGEHYDFDSFSDNHLVTYAQLHQKDKDGIIIDIPNPYNRVTMLNNIKRWKQMKNK